MTVRLQLKMVASPVLGRGVVKSLQLLDSRPYAKSDFYARELEGRGGVQTRVLDAFREVFCTDVCKNAQRLAWHRVVFSRFHYGLN